MKSDFDIKHKYSKDLTLTINYGIIFSASNVLQIVKMEKENKFLWDSAEQTSYILGEGGG